MPPLTHLPRGRPGHLLLPALLLSALLLATGAGRAQAQSGPRPLSGFPALTLTYTDPEGDGILTLIPTGAGPTTGSAALSAVLTRHAVTYLGDGYAYPRDGSSYALALTLSHPAAARYLLTGTLTRDQHGHWTGEGRSRAAWNPAVSGPWRMVDRGVPPALAVSVRLDPVDGTAARGNVILSARPDNETAFRASLTGLVPGREYTIQVQAGTLAEPGASVTTLIKLTADAWGRAAATGYVRFRGTEPVALADLATGRHSLTLSGLGRAVAAGAVPALDGRG